MAQSVLEKSFIPVEYFYGGEVLADGVTPDFYPAVCRAQAFEKKLDVADYFQPVHHSSFDFPPLEAINGTYESNALLDNHPYLRIVFRPVTYHFSQTIEIVRPVHLLGAGQYSTYGTVFSFPPNKGGIIVHSIRGGITTTRLKTDINGNLILDDEGKAQIEDDPMKPVTTSIPSYLSDTLVDRANLGDLFRMPANAGGYEWTVVNFSNCHGVNSIIEGINLRGIIESLDENGLISNNAYDIFPDMQIIAHDTTGNNQYSNMRFFLFSPYENHNRSANEDGSQQLPFDFKLYADLNMKAYTSVSHATKAAHGITSFSKLSVRDCTIENFAGHGIYLFGNSEGGVITTSEVRNTMVQNCCGNGYHFYGRDTSNLSIMGIQAKSVEGWGIVNLVTNSCNTILSSVFHKCVKGAFLCPPNVYINNFRVKIIGFERQARAVIYNEACNYLPIQSLTIIGCHAEECNYGNFSLKQPEDIFTVMGPQSGPDVMHPIIAFFGSPAMINDVKKRIYWGEILNNTCLILGGSVGSLHRLPGEITGVAFEGEPMVLWRGDGNVGVL